MSQSTDIQQFPIPQWLIEQAAMSGDRDPSRMNGMSIRSGRHAGTGEPWFVAADVCRVLEIRNVSDAMTRLDEDQYEQVSSSIVSTEVGSNLDKGRTMLIVSESGLYSLILGSRSAATRPFRRWVTDHVLPSIRRTGSYAVEKPKELTHLETAKALVEALEAREAMDRRRAEAEARAAVLGEAAQEARGQLVKARDMLVAVEPKVQAHDALLAADGRDWSMRDAAAILNRDPEIWKARRLGQNSLFALLRELRMVDNANHIYAAHKQHLRLLPMTYQHPHTGEPRASEQLRLTPLGLTYLQKRLGGGAPAVLQLDVAPVPV